jgi:hypothetical protein
MTRRVVRGIRFSDEEWAAVASKAAAAGVPLARYLRHQSLAAGGYQRAAMAPGCKHPTVLTVPGRLNPGAREICQCQTCGRIGTALPGESVEWAQ